MYYEGGRNGKPLQRNGIIYFSLDVLLKLITYYYFGAENFHSHPS
jgi:hypothetical protein